MLFFLPLLLSCLARFSCSSLCSCWPDLLLLLYICRPALAGFASSDGEIPQYPTSAAALAAVRARTRGREGGAT
ncbi:hypothetical protein BDY21DRAFT_347896 [Lineolata rhizophorae]|uniref:Secreted protein n=1 Tax=Lineolata rhizophorae TaxID=578093 RepID=A0A6A6NWK1_9PEZI|nr:hypothetical protein BDY21DRAFT_347896 [Lineolata rhizophorae]